eukprot:9914461-Alexandrium_andersonii.AAC.1
MRVRTQHETRCGTEHGTLQRMTHTTTRCGMAQNMPPILAHHGTVRSAHESGHLAHPDSQTNPRAPCRPRAEPMLIEL